MPYKNGNPSQCMRFNRSKKNALMGLVAALNEKTLPERSSSGKYSMYTGEIEKYFDERFLPLQRNALLTVLREADVPHDSTNRFVPSVIYSYEKPLENLLREYTGAAGLNLPMPPMLPVTEADAEAEAEIEKG